MSHPEFATRLCFGTCLAAVGVGLATALVQAENYERARRLADLQRDWEHLEAINVQREARAAAHVVGSGRQGAGRDDQLGFTSNARGPGEFVLEGVE